MTVVLEADVALSAPALPAPEEHADAADMLEELIASHRAALLALAPHQAERGVRVDTAWHIAELGLLLRVRDTLGLEARSTTGSTLVAGNRRTARVRPPALRASVPVSAAACAAQKSARGTGNRGRHGESTEPDRFTR